MGTEKRERQKLGRQARIEEARAAQKRAQRFRTVRNFGLVVVVILVALFALSQLTGKSTDPSTVTASGGPTSSAPSTAPTGSSTTAGTAAPTPPTLAPGAAITGDTPCPQADGSSARTTKFAKAPPVCIDPAKTYSATFDTTEGKVTVALDTKTTPTTANNFVVLARYHYYDGTALFRTDPGIGIIQGGGATTNSASDPGPGYELADEGFDFTAIGGKGGPYKYKPGDLVMARSSKPNGAGAQFFFGVTDAVSGLDGQGVYVKYGTTTTGLDVLQNILGLSVAGGQLGGAPSRIVTVTAVTITES